MTFTATRQRSIAKALLYRMLGTAETFGVVMVVGGTVETATTAAIALMIIKLVMYYLYERVWNLVKWGRK